MLHDLASAAAEWLADPRQGLGSAAPPRQPEAGVEADGGSGQALQHIDQVLRPSHCSRSCVHVLAYPLAPAGTAQHCRGCRVGGEPASRAKPQGATELLLFAGDSQVAEQLHRATATAAMAAPQRPRGQKQQQQQRQQHQRWGPADVEAENRRLAGEAAAAAAAPRLAAMRATRAGLPAAAAKGAVLQELQQHRVLVISGATGGRTSGCGSLEARGTARSTLLHAYAPANIPFMRALL